MAYHVELEVFEGPLDLLLYLIQQARIDIKDIFVSEITAQYLAYVTHFQQQDMERASEFLAMAAHLLEIKSRRMLPRAREEDPELEAQEADLIAQLEAYRQYKQACVALSGFREEASRIYARLPEERTTEERIDLKALSVQALAEAMRALQLRLLHADDQPPAEREIERETFTVQEKILFIRTRLLREREVGFTSLFGATITRNEIVTTFMALLEMVKRNLIHVIQEDRSQEIRICRPARREEAS